MSKLETSIFEVSKPATQAPFLELLCDVRPHFKKRTLFSNRVVLGTYKEFFDDSGRFGKLASRPFQNIQNLRQIPYRCRERDDLRHTAISERA